jgi:Fe-S-cluster containining protein
MSRRASRLAKRRPKRTLPQPKQRDVSCEGCGACCMHMGYPPFAGMFTEPEAMSRSDPEWLALYRVDPKLALKAREGAIAKRGDNRQPCLWLDLTTFKCKHYEHRPAVCRDFERGSDACLEHRKVWNITL